MRLPVRGLLTDVGQHDDVRRPVVETTPVHFADHPTWAKPYQTARVSRLPIWIDPGEPGSHIDMAAGVLAVVTTEAPVHVAVLHQRLRDAWDIGRIGARIRENLDLAIPIAGILREGDFLTLADSGPTVVRTPVDGFARRVEHVHDDELMLALVIIARDASAISYGELTEYVARLYGWNRRGPDISSRLAALVSRLRARESWSAAIAASMAQGPSSRRPGSLTALGRGP